MIIYFRFHSIISFVISDAVVNKTFTLNRLQKFMKIAKIGLNRVCDKGK